jgi:PAP2 superfamily protein
MVVPALVSREELPRLPGRVLGRLADVPDWLREVVLLGGLYLAYELGRMVSRDELSEALVNSRHLLGLERAWHLDPEHPLNHAVSGHLLLAVPAAYFYSTLHYLVTPLVLLWMYRRHREHYRTARTTLAVGTVLALTGFYLLPTAPPRLLGSTGLSDTLADVRAWGWWGGDGSVPRGMGGLSNQFAAMPSLHVGWAVWSGVLVAMFASAPVMRAIGAAYPVLTTVVVLATGNHYLLDTVAGAAVIGVGALAALVIQAGLRRLWLSQALPRASSAHGRRPETQPPRTIQLPEPRAQVRYDVGSGAGAEREELRSGGGVLAHASLERRCGGD